MGDSSKGSSNLHHVIEDMREKNKEIATIFKIEGVLSSPGLSVDKVFSKIIPIIEGAWRYPEVCLVRITFEDLTFASENFVESPWVQSADIIIGEQVSGTVEICYTEERPVVGEGPFSNEERQLLNKIAERLSHYFHFKNTSDVGKDGAPQGSLLASGEEKWQIILTMISKTDVDLLTLLTRKMMYRLCWSGSQEAQRIMREFDNDGDEKSGGSLTERNRPTRKVAYHQLIELKEKIFSLAARSYSNEKIISLIERWIQEHNARHVIMALENHNTSLREVAEALATFIEKMPGEIKLSKAITRFIVVAIIRRFVSDDPQFVNNAKQYCNIRDLNEVFQHIICSSESHGKLGGKAAGLFLANLILQKSQKVTEKKAEFKTPKTWYVASDVMIEFIRYNNLRDVIEQKYRNLDQIRKEYPHTLQVFKHSKFPVEIVNSLSVALDDLGDKPLVVRSSSLLEDSVDSSFAGKYKSLFLANRGSKKQRLEALLDAISEIYASTFAPDPIMYRSERGLLDFNEQMGVIVQEVVGTKVGSYFFPSYAGVAFSNNEFRWSNRIKKEDGLIRLVPGLGTRAVDRLTDDYPILIAPGQPGLRANVTFDDRVRYSPKWVDVINLDSNDFVSLDFYELLKNVREKYPQLKRVVSINENGVLNKAIGFELEDKDVLQNSVVTFEGLFTETSFIDRIYRILNQLKKTLGYPVDIEFASDGESIYLLQCRPQSRAGTNEGVNVPENVPVDQVIFSANRYITDGFVTDISHVVYVDPDGYNKLPDLNSLVAVGEAVGRLNKLLPKRKFILMGPGRWGSRGDIKLGVKVSYADINNSAVLIEIAQKKGNYTPDLSFGTHFFQDLVEADIKYIPLYPDDAGILFNKFFLQNSKNLLHRMLPKYSDLSEVIKVIDISQETGGGRLNIFMNADQDKALGVLVKKNVSPTTGNYSFAFSQLDSHWNWRIFFAREMAKQLNSERFGVKSLYLAGSSCLEKFSKESDIDIVIEFIGTPAQKTELLLWFEGWSNAFGALNYLRTGVQTHPLLDLHFVEEDRFKAEGLIKLDLLVK